MKDKILNTLSLINLSLGFISVFLSIQGFFSYASYLIIGAALIDLAYIAGAGVTKTGEVFAKDLNNLAEFGSFALAPAVLTYMVFYGQLTGYLPYIFLAFPLALLISGALRTARLSSGKVTSWNGMKLTFNAVIPVLYLLNFFSIFLVSGWFIISSVFSMSRFNFRGSLKKKKKEKVAELKDDSPESDDYSEKYRKRRERRERKKDEENNLVPLAIFGD